MPIETYRSEHLPELQMLINHHVSAVLPGWALPAAYIEQHLARHPQQIIIDPWVAERKTLVVTQRDQAIAAVHLLRYAEDDGVGSDYRGAGDIAWLFASPEHQDAASALLEAAKEQMQAWNASRVSAWDSGLPIGPSRGIPDVWAHLADVFMRGGFSPNPERNEALFGGWLDSIPLPGDAPVDGLTIRRSVGNIWGTRFTGWRGAEVLGWCECVGDLSEGGALPSLRGWGELAELYVEETWRNGRIGTWLVRQAVEWMRLAGCRRVVLTVAPDDEAAGAGRFYRRFGWDVFTRLQDGWGCQAE